MENRIIDIIIKEILLFYKIIKFLIPSIPITIQITLYSFLLAVILGLIIALFRISYVKIFQIISKIYVDVLRGIPLLVQIFFIYFGLGKILKLEQFTAGVIAISICYSAYISEIFRAGILAIPKGQYDASKSLGMNKYQTMRYVILPQAIRIIIPPISNEFIACLKDSSLVSIIGMRELTRAGREFYSQYFVDFEIWFIVGMFYLIMTAIAAKFARYIEKKLEIP